MADEKRLIDANTLEAYFHETKIIEIFPYWKELSFKTQSELVRFGKAVKEIIQKAPTVDVVEVVRCRECKEFKPGFIRPYLGWCQVWDTTVRETGFCHHGKPRCGEAEKPVWPPEEEPEVACED